MFENMNPMDRPTAFFEIAVLLLISFIIGFVAAKLPVSAISGFTKNKQTNDVEDEFVDPRDIITEPTSIKAVLTRDRKGNAIETIKTVERKTETAPVEKIAAIKKDYSSRSKKNKNPKA